MTAADLRAWRKRLGWTQREAAQALGLSHTHYCKLEAGTYSIKQSIELACRLLERS